GCHQMSMKDSIFRSLKVYRDLGSYQGVSLVVLNLGIDTKSPTGRLMLTMIGAVASFERQLLLERQAEGIEIAKAKGKYKGRKATPLKVRKEVLRMLEGGASKAQISQELNISLSSVYRFAKSVTD
ncbi:recombinase family protein, partial [Vibrio sp. DNB22_17_1]